MRQILIAILLISTGVLFAQALPRAIFQKIQTADGSQLTPEDMYIRAYFQNRPEEVHTNLSRPKHIKLVQIDTEHKGYYVLLNVAAFPSNWETGEILVADITQKSTGSFLHFEIKIPEGTNIVWLENPLTLKNSVPHIAENPIPEDNAENIPWKKAKLAWSFIQKKGYPAPAGFRVVIDSDTLFSNPKVLYLKKTKAKNVSVNLAKHAITLSPATTYYWKVIPTTSTDPKIQPSNLHPLVIDGKLLSSKESGDAIEVPVWCFTTSQK